MDKYTNWAYKTKNEIKTILPTVDVDKDVVLIPADELNFDRQDSVWYGGYLGEIKYNGVVYEVHAVGEVRATLFDDSNEEIASVVDKSRAGKFRYEMEHYIKNDDELRKLENEGKLYFENNNWFEILVFDDIESPLHGQINEVSSVTEVFTSLAEYIKDAKNSKHTFNLINLTYKDENVTINVFNICETNKIIDVLENSNLLFDKLDEIELDNDNNIINMSEIFDELNLSHKLTKDEINELWNIRDEFGYCPKAIIKIAQKVYGIDCEIVTNNVANIDGSYELVD